MPFEPTHEEIRLARQTSWQVGRRWASVEIEDLRQHLWLWLCEHAEQVQRFRTSDGGRGKLALSLKREALRYCTKESAARQGKSLERENFYTEDVIRNALPFLFQAWPETSIRQDPNTGRNLDRPFSSGDALAIMADIQSAFKKLPPQNQMVLELRYQEDLTQEDVANRLAISQQAISETIAKSVKQMSEYLSR